MIGKPNPTSFRIPQEMLDQIRQLARSDHRSLSSMLLALLSDALDLRLATGAQLMPLSDAPSQPTPRSAVAFPQECGD